MKHLIDKALNIYKYGSTVYGTYVDGVSDKDFILVLPDTSECENGFQFEIDNCQYTCYQESEWRRMLYAHDVCAVETVFLPETDIVRETVHFDFCVDKNKLRESFSHVASNSWVKCKKKLTVEKDYAPRIGKKSLWHALRILDFGIQIAQYGRIVSFGSTNDMYDEIVNCEINDYAYYKQKYQALYNAKKSLFRTLAPKPIQN